MLTLVTNGIYCYRYPFNNALHHHVESIIYSSLESKNDAIVDHLLGDCNLVGKIIDMEKSPTLSGTQNQVIVWSMVVSVWGCL